ncbi:MAG: hypothetical protein PHS41_02065 [Victivallaceae bacterium]|nr:hypothetical protein [Victivallaceae bacterium]
MKKQETAMLTEPEEQFFRTLCSEKNMSAPKISGALDASILAYSHSACRKRRGGSVRRWFEWSFAAVAAFAVIAGTVWMLPDEAPAVPKTQAIAAAAGHKNRTVGNYQAMWDWSAAEEEAYELGMSIEVNSAVLACN